MFFFLFAFLNAKKLHFEMTSGLFHVCDLSLFYRIKCLSECSSKSAPPGRSATKLCSALTGGSGLREPSAQRGIPAAMHNVHLEKIKSILIVECL